MNVKITAPYGCKSSSIPLSDVIRIEYRTLYFFETSAHNLYITVGLHQDEEVYSLFSYRLEKDMLFAYNTIASLLKKKPTYTITLDIEPMQDY